MVRRLLLALLLLFAPAALAQVPPTNTFYVSTYGNDSYGGISWSTAKATIAAAIAACPSDGCIIHVAAGTYSITSKLLIQKNHLTLFAYGASLNCNLASPDDCVMIGSTSNPTLTSGVTIYGLHLAPGPNSAANSAFRDNAQNTHFIDIGGTGQWNYGSSSWYTFGHFTENDDDQSEVVDHQYDMNPAANIITCNASFCGSALWAPGPFSTNAGITWLKNSNLSLGCTGNGIDWQSGNHLTVSDSIFQGYSQFAWRISYSSAEFDGWNHTERGGCVNPLNDGNGHALGGAGLTDGGRGQCRSARKRSVRRDDKLPNQFARKHDL